MPTIGGYTPAKIQERALERGRSVEEQQKLDSRSGAEKRRNRPNRIKPETTRKKGAKSEVKA